MDKLTVEKMEGWSLVVRKDGDGDLEVKIQYPRRSDSFYLSKSTVLELRDYLNEAFGDE